MLSTDRIFDANVTVPKVAWYPWAAFAIWFVCLGLSITYPFCERLKIGSSLVHLGWMKKYKSYCSFIMCTRQHLFSANVLLAFLLSGYIR